MRHLARDLATCPLHTHKTGEVARFKTFHFALVDTLDSKSGTETIDSIILFMSIPLIYSLFSVPDLESNVSMYHCLRVTV